MSQETEKLAERLQEEVQARLHTGLEARAEVVPNGEAIRIDVMVPEEADSQAPWSRHVLLSDLQRDDEALESMAKLLAERASREWLARRTDDLEN